ncbi:MAG TPA: substrate-binding domain-containing protein, partial [Nitrospirales bacterium]|nr:substrate-binding domain-containing protein [Nitrospirales bacterium]
LRLAAALHCSVEDLFALAARGEIIEGELIGDVPSAGRPLRVKVARIGKRVVVRPVASLGDVFTFTVPADGLMLGPVPGRRSRRVRVELLRDRQQVEDEVIVGGCDPAIVLTAEYLRRRDAKASVVGWTMGSAAALDALAREEVHIAGVHVVDQKSGEHNLPYIKKRLGRQDVTVVTFASWEEGLIVAARNPKSIRDAGDLARKDVTIVNREAGAGARHLLDRALAGAGVKASSVKGYERHAASHVDVARMIAHREADAGIGIRSAAAVFGLDFIPLQTERYDLVMPTASLHAHRGVGQMLDALVTRGFRAEIDALGGYDTSETGKIQSAPDRTAGGRT